MPDSNSKEFTIIRDHEEYRVAFTERGNLDYILFYSIYLDEWVEATAQLSKYEILTDEANELYQEWLKETKAKDWEYDTLEEKYG